MVDLFLALTEVCSWSSGLSFDKAKDREFDYQPQQIKLLSRLLVFSRHIIGFRAEGWEFFEYGPKMVCLIWHHERRVIHLVKKQTEFLFPYIHITDTYCR